MGNSYFKVTPENSVFNNLPAVYLYAQENAEMWEAINRSQPNDYIRLDKAEDIALCKLWRKSRSLPGGEIPSDIFFAGKIRFMDCYIAVDERADNGVVIEYRVVVFSDYQERIRAAAGRSVVVGAIVVESQDFALFIPLNVCEAVDVMMAGPVGFHNTPDELIKDIKKTVKQMDIQQMGFEFKNTWYGIQTTPQAFHRA